MNAKNPAAPPSPPSPPHTMNRLALLFGALVLAISAATPLAWAAVAKGPKSLGAYTGTGLNINVNQSATKVRVSSTCSSSGASPIFYQWQSPILPLHNNAFSFNGRQSIHKLSVQTGMSTGEYQADVVVNGHFAGGKFEGVFHLGGSPCAKLSYVAKLATSSGSGGA